MENRGTLGFGVPIIPFINVQEQYSLGSSIPMACLLQVRRSRVNLRTVLIALKTLPTRPKVRSREILASYQSKYLRRPQTAPRRRLNYTHPMNSVKTRRQRNERKSVNSSHALYRSVAVVNPLKGRAVNWLHFAIQV